MVAPAGETTVTDVYTPVDLEEATEFLARHPGAVPVAGGTDVMIDRRLGRLETDWLVDLSRLEGLGSIEVTDDTVTVGALTPVRALELDSALMSVAPALVEAARVLGSVQVRNMATLGGNLCHATPSAELAPPLLALGAIATVRGPGGGRELPVADLFGGPGVNTLAPGELLTRVTFPVVANSGSTYLRQTIRWSMDLAGVGTAAWMELDSGGRVTSARVALGAVAPTPLAVPGVAELLGGRNWGHELGGEVAALASGACSPISDARGTARYRRHVAGVLARRALHIAWLRAGGDWPDGTPAPVNGVLPPDGATADDGESGESDR